MGIIRRDYHKRGSWNAVSDLDGQKRKASDMRMQWNNLWVGKDEWSPKQPQQDLRPRYDNPARYPIRATEPQTVPLTDGQLDVEVYSSTGVAYLVNSLVLASDGTGYVVESQALSSNGTGYDIFTYDWQDIAADNPGIIYVPPPITTAQMI